MPYATTQITSATLTSSALSVNWRGGKPWTALVTIASSSGTGPFYVQYTLQDITSSAFNPGLGGLPIPVAPTWNNITAANGVTGLSSSVLSSAAYPSLQMNSSTVDSGAGLMVWGTYPIAGIRLNSTVALSSQTLTLTLLQGEGW